MLGFVLSALGAARIADVGTQRADRLGEIGAAAHIGGRRPANFGAIIIEPNALGHLFYIAFRQARVGTMLALLGAADAGLDTRLVFVVCHGKYS
jgi:hypothetical protein